MTFPLAIIAPYSGIKSETFIHRHMMELLPGKTIVVVRHKGEGNDAIDLDLPCLILEEQKKSWKWIYRASCFALHLNKLSPVQISVKEYFKQNDVQVVLSEYLNQSLKWISVARELGIRFFAHAHGCDISVSLRDPEMRHKYLQLEAADGIITMSEISRKRLIALGLDSKKIHVIPYGVDVLDKPVERSVSSTIRCLAVGRMVAKKAPLFTLNAFKKALVDFPDLHLDYVGEGELFDDAVRFVDEYGMNNQVTFHGGQPHGKVLDLMTQADIFLQHSRTDPISGDEEGLPVAILEAMANSLPIVSTRHAGIPEAVIENKTGYLVDEGDTDEMAKYIIRLAKDANLRKCLGNAGWIEAKERFSSQKQYIALRECLGL